MPHWYENVVFVAKLRFLLVTDWQKMPHTLGKTLKIWSVLAKLRV
jgi:hypothetical protein